MMISVICTASAKPELINDFLIKTYDGYPEAAQFLVVLTTLDLTRYSDDQSLLNADEARKHHSKVLTHGGGPMKVPSRPPWTVQFTSPFLGKTPEQVANILLEEAPDCIDSRFCAILDEQSVKDGSTVLLVKTRKTNGDNLPVGCEDREIIKVREEWKEANAVLQSASAGHSSLESMLWNNQQCSSDNDR